MKKLPNFTNFAVVKRKLYIFNPENDMALGCGGNSYNAPAWTIQFKNDLELLPAYYAQPGSWLLVQDAQASQLWLSEHNLDIEAIEATQLRKISNVEVVPWGWSWHLCQQLVAAGLRSSELPIESEMQAVRALAHRRSSIAIHTAIAQEMGQVFSPTPVEIYNTAAVIEWAKTHPAAYIKTPWSGSGRGIYRATDVDTPQFARWCKGAIARQGSVLCEEALDRVLDFALEWKCEDGCNLVGYSVFSSDGQNQYGGGIVESNQTLHNIIAQQYPAIDSIVQAMRNVLTRIIAPHYAGYVGVDMLLYRNCNGEIAIDPCVEVNLRCTMGLVTCALGETHGMRGRFSIVPSQQAHRPLTPIYHNTRHTATLLK